MRILLAVATTMAIAACGRGQDQPAATATPTATPESPAVTAEKWRAKHEVDYRRDWVSIAGLHRLKQGANSAGSAPANDIVLPASVPATIGKFVRDGVHVRFEPAKNSPVMRRVADPATNATRKEPVTAAIDLRDDGGPGEDELTVGDVRMVVHVSGENRSLRVRDPNGPLATGFAGFAWFPIDPAYRVVGRFIKDDQPRSLKVENTVGDIDEYKTEGVVEFTLQGQIVRLRPFTTRPKRFYFVFRDASSGHETYGTARFLYADLLDDGSVVLDFNMAYNPPCAFNPYTTCPVPLRENRLPIKVLAGEQAYAGPEPIGR